MPSGDLEESLQAMAGKTLGNYKDGSVRTLKIIVTEIQTNPSVQMVAMALTVGLVTVLLTVLVVTLSGQQQKR